MQSSQAWGKVTETIEKALIVASGPSVKAIDWYNTNIAKNVSVICVNGTLPHVPQATHWFSLDLSAMNKEVMWQQRMKQIKFYAGAFDDYPRTEGWVTFLKRRLGTGPRNCCYGLSEDPEWISTGNSAYGALGLCYLMKAKKVAMLGVDGTWKYWYAPGGPSGPLDVIRKMFDSAVAQTNAMGMEVVNGSPESIVDCFLKMEPKDAIEWINSV